MTEIVAMWRASLTRFLAYYDANRGPIIIFYPMLFVFFVVVNIACYWWAMITAFPDLINAHYFKIQFPVGILGALFDSLSFFVTVCIVRRAVRTEGVGDYVAHLSIDLIIAVLATFWVVYVFIASGWIVTWFEAAPESMAVRAGRYEEKVVAALASPADNMRNIYFGLVMGVSAMLPTCFHISLFLQACWRRLSLWFAAADPKPLGFRLSSC